MVPGMELLTSVGLSNPRRNSRLVRKPSPIGRNLLIPTIRLKPAHLVADIQLHSPGLVNSILASRIETSNDGRFKLQINSPPF